MYVWAASDRLVSRTWKVHPLVLSPSSAFGRNESEAPTTLGYTDEVVAACASTIPAPTQRGDQKVPSAADGSTIGWAVPIRKLGTNADLSSSLSPANIGSVAMR